MTCLLKMAPVATLARLPPVFHCSGHSWPKGVVTTFVHSFMHSIQEAIKLR